MIAVDEPAGSEQRFFFCHLQKTAGSSLIARLCRHFPEDRVYPNRHDGEKFLRVISVRHLLARWEARGRDITLVAGHFPLCTQQLLGGGFRTFAVLREPVERTLSYLRHHRRLVPADRNRPLEAIYENPFQFNGLIHNHMVKMLSLTVEEMTHGALTPVTFTREHLDRAKAQLSALDVLGVQDQFETFCDELQERFGLQLGAPVFVNLTQRVPVSAAFRDRIAQDNALDVELYEAARALVAARSAARATAAGGSAHVLHAAE